MIKFAYLPLAINLIIVLLLKLLPSFANNKNYPLVTVALCKQVKSSCSCNLYVKYYKVTGGGYLTTDVDSVYLTDLNHFSQYIGTFDEGYEHIDITCKGDQIKTKKTSDEYVNTYWGPPQLIEKKVFSLKRLVEQNDFD